MEKKDYERIKKWVEENTHTLPYWGDEYVYVESLLEFLKSITKEED